MLNNINYILICIARNLGVKIGAVATPFVHIELKRNYIQKLSEYFNENNKSIDETSTSDAFVNLNAVTMPMAKIIPILNGQVPESPTPGDLPSDWLQRLLLSEELKALGANIYEAFSY